MTRPEDEAPESSRDLADDEDAGTPLLPLLDAEAGPALPRSERELLLLADRVERQFAQRARAARRVSPRRLLLAAGLFAASAAAAVYSVGVLQREAPAPGTPPAVVPGSDGAATPGVAPSPPVPKAAVPEAAVPEAPSSELVAPPAPGVPPEEPPSVPSESKGPSIRQDRPAELDPVAPKANNVGLARQTAPRQVVADRLAAANALRARHRYREALALYLQVIDSDPNGMQASVARVAAAEMQLEQLGDVAGAERLYREAKTQGGELTAEAQFGLAQVARARGDAPGERRALQDFLLRHPESPLVSAARRRMHTLGAE